MRDSFGGVFMFKLMLVFIFIFVAFTAVSLTYAKAFRLKNSLITYVEEQEIVSLNLDNNKLDGINKILQNAQYNKTCNSIGLDEGEIVSKEGNITGYCYKGVVIQIKKDYPKEIEGTKAKLIEYEIITYADWNLGALNKILILGGKKENSESYVNGTWTIKGTAKVITNK